MKLSKLFRGFEVKNFREVDIRDISYDSRNCEEGALFVALKGNNYDAHRFIDSAIKNGAVALALQSPVTSRLPYIIVDDTKVVLAELSSRFFDAPSKNMKVIGITGTNGKTTTSFLLHRIIRRAYQKAGLLGTILYDTIKEVKPALKTTPEAPELERYLKEILDMGGMHTVMEVSSHAIKEERIRCIDFTGLVFTNLSKEHLDYHRTFEDYRDTKLRIFRELEGENRFAVINCDDPSAVLFIEATNVPLIRYGLREDADLSANIEYMDFQRTLFSVEGLYSGKIELKLPGVHNVYNALASLGVSHFLRINWEIAKGALEELTQISGRFQLVSPEDSPIKVIVDYAHTPDAMDKLLTSIRNLEPKRIILVFGAGGDRDRKKRSVMGQIAEDMADLVVLTSDNPRTEDPLSIIKEIKKGFRNSTPIIIPDRKEAICEAIRLAQEDDVVVIAGKGHEKYQVIGDEKLPFDDTKLAREALESEV